MRIRVFTWIALLALVVVAAAGAAELRPAKYAIPDQYIVVLKDDVARSSREAGWAPTVSAVAQDMAVIYGAKVEHVYEHALSGFVGRLEKQDLERLLNDPRVAYVEEDGLVWASATQSGATWGLDRIDQRNLPLSGTYTYDTTATNVRVYVIDTGIRAAHSDFGGRVLAGYTAISDGRGTEDCSGHGTHVAGTVGGATWGVAKGVRLVPVRVLDCQGSGTNSGVIAGVDWVTANRVKPAVANMSLGGGISTALDNAVTNSINAGVFYAVAAGNENQNACNSSPARVAAAMTVGATTNTDARASFSNWGTCLDIFAPGNSITSAWYTSNTATNSISGTSMASPHVAGVGALYLANNPTATPAQVKAALIDNATPNKVTSPGTGSPNRLLYSLFGGGTPVDNPPTASFTFSCTNLTCSFNGSGSSDDKGITSYAWTFGDGSSGSGVTTSRTYAAAGTYSVTLTVTDTAGQKGSQTKAVTVTAAPSSPCPTCEYYTGSLTAGASQYQPNGNYFYVSKSGTHLGYLRGPAGADFDLYLQKWNGSTWVTVKSGTSATANEDVSYSGTAGYYVWRIYSYRGAGSYQFWMKRP